MRRSGERVVRALGYDAGERRRVVKALGIDAGEGRRVRWQTRPPVAGGRLSRDQRLDRDYFAYWYPLYEWGFDRQRCVEAIERAGLLVPAKSACFFSELMARALAIEDDAQGNLTSVEGLGRSFSWRDFLAGVDDTPLFDCRGE